MQFCDRPGCNRAGDDLGNCGHFVIKCPRPKEVDPKKHIVLRCSSCDKTRCVAVGDIMQGRSKLREDCGRTDCLAVVVPVKAAAKAKPVSDGPPDDIQ